MWRADNLPPLLNFKKWVKLLFPSRCCVYVINSIELYGIKPKQATPDGSSMHGKPWLHTKPFSLNKKRQVSYRNLSLFGVPGGARTHNVGVGGRGFIQLDYRHILYNYSVFIHNLQNLQTKNFTNNYKRFYSVSNSKISSSGGVSGGFLPFA